MICKNKAEISDHQSARQSKDKKCLCWMQQHMFLKVTCFHTVNNNLATYQAPPVEKSSKEWRDKTGARPREASRAKNALRYGGEGKKEEKAQYPKRGIASLCVKVSFTLAKTNQKREA